jgi:hypothetical protein
VNELHATADFSTFRYLEPAVVTRRRGDAGIHAPRDADSGAEDHGEKDRYRVDAAYRAYQRSRAAPPSDRERSLRTASSAELLSSMIHQMGGAHTSSAKGTFVDISI